MSVSSPQCALFLYPVENDFFPVDLNSFVKILQNIHLINNPVNNQENCFYTGERYLEYIAYLGCSPTIQFEESKTSDTFCYIKIHLYNTAKLLVNQIQTRAPQCPNCNKPVKDWKKNINNETLYCNQCSSSSNLANYNWKKNAGYAQLFIEITDIFPKEAVPQQMLLNQLAEMFHTKWNYFYCCQ